jgi:TonB family protein
MFHVLPASRSHSDFRRRWLISSIIAHALVLGIAVSASQSALEARKATPREEPMLLFVPRSPEPEHQAPLPDALLEPSPKAFPSIPVPSEVPLSIPPIDLRQRPLDPSDFVSIGRENGFADGSSTEVAANPDGIYDASSTLEGFEPAVLLSQPRPRYPATLQSAGVAGTVLVEFVIDTIGRVEAGSVRIIESSHPGFEDAARAAVLGARFQPARHGRQPVRQITRQRVRFVAEPQ